MPYINHTSRSIIVTHLLIPLTQADTAKFEAIVDALQDELQQQNRAMTTLEARHASVIAQLQSFTDSKMKENDELQKEKEKLQMELDNAKVELAAQVQVQAVPPKLGNDRRSDDYHQVYLWNTLIQKDVRRSLYEPDRGDPRREIVGQGDLYIKKSIKKSDTADMRMMCQLVNDQGRQLFSSIFPPSHKAHKHMFVNHEDELSIKWDAYDHLTTGLSSI